jgi:hypothetical protein
MGDCIARDSLVILSSALACLHIDWGFISLNVTAADQLSPHRRDHRDQQLADFEDPAVQRKIGPDVWEFRWREPGPRGKRRHRRMVIGRIDQLVDESAARGRIAALHLDINFWDARLKGKPLTISELAEGNRSGH